MTTYSDDQAYVNEILDFILNHGENHLPELTPNQTPIKWFVVKGNAQITNNIVYKSNLASENEPIILKATLTYEGATKDIHLDGLVLKDPYVAHLMTYFNHGEGPNSGSNPKAGMRLAYSLDGLDWLPLNNGHSVINATGGTTNWLRDPHAFRKKDGSFGIVSTQGWDTPFIFMWETEDMVSFTEHYLRASYAGPVDDNREHNLSGLRAWAPKVMYDRLSENYFVFWADPKDPSNDDTNNAVDRPMYYNATKDFQTLSEPGVYFSAGYPIIDAMIVKDQGVYYMYFKDERIGEKRIRVAKSTSLTPGSFVLTEEVASHVDDQVEGPFAFKSLADNNWYLYYDDFSDTHTYKYSKTKDLSTGHWIHCGINPNLPIAKLDYKTRISHGGQISITQKELDRILKAWK